MYTQREQKLDKGYRLTSRIIQIFSEGLSSVPCQSLSKHFFAGCRFCSGGGERGSAKWVWN